MINWITPEMASDITPATAAKMLESNVAGNRKLRKQHVAYLVRQILAGNWILIGNPIAFNILKQLIDGQHRLEACVQADMPIKAFAMTGLAVEAFKNTDAGLPRGMHDVTDFSVNEVAILRAYGKFMMGQGVSKMSAREIERLYAERAVHFNLAFEKRTSQRNIGLTPIWAAIAYYSEHDHKKAAEFADAFKTGVTMMTQPQVFRNHLLTTDYGTGSVARKRVIERALYCMDAHYRGKNISRSGILSADRAFK